MTKTTEKRFVKVEFTSEYDRPSTQKLYTYQDNLDTPLKPFDVVLVPTQYGYSVAVVIEDNAPKPALSTKEVAELIKSETLDAINNRKKADALRKALDKKLKEVDEIERYKKYAGDNPEIAAMVEELERLRG